jgi:hypothetical protein
VLRSACLTDWAELGVYAAIGVGATLLLGLPILALVKKYVAKQTLELALFSLGFVTAAAGLFSDAYSYLVMIQYLQTRSRICQLLNEIRVFLPQLGSIGSPQALQNVPGNYSFANWIAPQFWDASFGGEFSNGAYFISLYTSRFDSACRQAPECAFDAALKHCYEARPDLATSGGGAHQTFLLILWVLVWIRIAYELFCLISIAVSCVRNSVVMGCRIFMVDSVFFPLLLMRATTRQVMLGFVLTERKPKHFIIKLLTSGLFIAVAKLVANTYYLVYVAQNGLVWSNWLSLILGLVAVPKMVCQATWSWWKQRRAAAGVDTAADTLLHDIVSATGSGSQHAAETEMNRSPLQRVIGPILGHVPTQTLAVPSIIQRQTISSVAPLSPRVLPATIVAGTLVAATATAASGIRGRSDRMVSVVPTERGVSLGRTALLRMLSSHPELLASPVQVSVKLKVQECDRPPQSEQIYSTTEQVVTRREDTHITRMLCFDTHCDTANKLMARGELPAAVRRLTVGVFAFCQVISLHASTKIRLFIFTRIPCPCSCVRPRSKSSVTTVPRAPLAAFCSV